MYEIFSYNPKMIELARESRGLTQSELCSLMNVAQGTISKLENSELFISDEYIEKISEILNYPRLFFAQKDPIYPMPLIYYRKRSKVSGKVQKIFEAKMNIIRFHIEKLLKRVEIPDPNLIDWDVERNGSPERAAMFLREFWKVPKGRIENLIRLVENNGIIVIRFKFLTDKIDGFSVFTVKNQPIIFVNSDLSSDREILTIAHELGHIMMHFCKITDLDRDLEKEAFRFGSEFLVPEFEFKRGFSKLTLKSLADLKRYWHISMSSMVVKASNLGIITKNEEKYLWQQLSPYRLREPESLDFPKDTPMLVKEIIDLHKSDFDFTNERLSEELNLNIDEFKDYYGFDTKGNLTILR